MEMKDKGSENKEAINEIRLLLDEKRTSISIMITGVAVLIAQLLIYSILIATSKFYEIVEVVHLIIPFYVINLALLILACYLIIHSLFRIRHFNRLILQVKKRKGLLTDFIGP